MVVLSIETSGCQPQTIVIGRRGTYETTQIAFDLSYLVEAYGSGVAVLAVKRSQDESAYPAVVTQEDNTLTWTVSETDTYYVGSGECQLMWYVDGGLAKTIIYPMVVMRDILQTAEEPPDGYENWIEHLTGLGAETQQNAQNAAQSATEAKASEESAAESAQRAEDAAGMLVDVSATATTLEPGQPATAEYDEGVFKFGIPKGDKLTYADLTEADKEDLVQGPIKAAQNDAIEAVGTAKTNAVDAVNQAGTTNKNAVTQEGTTQVNAVREAGTTQVGRVTTEGNTQVDRVQDKGDEVIASIPSDYSDLVDDVADLTRQLSDLEDAVTDPTTGLDTKAPVILETVSGAIASFSDGADSMPIKSLVASIEPAQDLHGYDYPWPGGGGKNKFKVTATTQTINGVTFTVNNDGTIVANGTASGNAFFVIGDAAFLADSPSGTYALNGCPTGGGYQTYNLHVIGMNGSDSGNGNTITFSETISLTNVRIRIYSGVTVSNLVFRPMIRLATETDATFVPYSNICPISGWAGLTGQRTGKNLLPNNLVNGTIDGVLYTKNSDDSISVSGTATNVSIKVISTIKLPAGSYTVNGGVTSASISVRKGNASGAQLAASSGSDVTFTLSEATTLAVVIRVANGITVSETVYPMIRLVSESDSTFEPYTGNQISINWEDEAGTVYGGQEEVVSGGLSSDMGHRIFNGSEGWNAHPTIPSWFYIDNALPGAYYESTKADFALSNIYTQVTYASVSNMVNGKFALGLIGSVPRLVVKDTRFTTAEEFKAGLASENMEIVYKLAEPQTYQLAENPVDTLYGTNNIWADVGTVDVEYPADTKMYIDNKIMQAIANALNS